MYNNDFESIINEITMNVFTKNKLFYIVMSLNDWIILLWSYLILPAQCVVYLKWKSIIIIFNILMRNVCVCV